MNRKKKLCLSICDYSKKAVCDIYDNQSDISGQAVNVKITTERNGWKELTFDIPSSCMGENGLEENYRLNYLIAEYKIKAVTDAETDWFIISEPHVTHSGFSKNVSVRAGHVSQTLKNKNIDLEFSDDEGNNVGTAEQLLTTILEGSGWHVGYVEVFKEDNGDVKSRSISGKAGSGALSFIEQLCDTFDAKPIYHGDTQTVDIVSMNPFKKIDPEEIPHELVDNGNVIELCYNRNTHDLSKTTNTENMATRLYAYGSSGDLNGICTLQTVEHSEYVFLIETTGNEYCFEDLGEKRHFFTGNVSVGDTLVYSDMDLTSQLYIWNETKEEAYPLYDKPKGVYVTLSDPDYEIKRNYFPYLLGLQYYYDVGLMTNEQFQQVAKFQRDLEALYQISEESATEYISGEQELSRIAEHNTGLLKLNIQEQSSDEGYAKLIINTSENNGVIYRTDYDVAERKFFQWHIAKALQANGDPVSGTPSVLLVIHNTNPVTWDKIYLKAVYDNTLEKVVDIEGNPADFKYTSGGFPTAITVWSTDLRWSSTDRVYLFCTNSMSGLLGARMSEDEALLENLYNKTDKHYTTFWDADSNIVRPSPRGADYEWLYAYHKDYATLGSFYFCWSNKNDNTWRYVYMQETEPSPENDAYFYNLKYKTLWHGENGSWVKCDSAAEQRVADHFTKVYYYCRRRDMLYKGLYEFYTHPCINLPAGNYAIRTDFGFFWTFKTTNTTTSTLKLDTVHGYVIPDGNMQNVVSISTIPYETVVYPSENELENKSFYLGDLVFENGTEVDSTNRYRTGTIRVYESKEYSYKLPTNSMVCFYDVNLKHLGSLSIGGTGTFTTLSRTRYLRIVTPTKTSERYLRLINYNSEFYINEEFYSILNPVNPSSGENELIGINPLMEKFADLADQTYGLYLAQMIESQEDIRNSTNALTESLSDMLKDGRWQDSNYVSGDEKRLYDDAMDMLRQISMPEIEYSFTYLDMFGVQNEHYYEEYESDWPDIKITDAAHLIDTEINANCWAYIDKIGECFDKPWETTVDIDTKLTLAARHGFTDVIARIAEVAKQINSKQSQYDQASTGKITGTRLEGQILLNQAYLDGGSSNWHTDSQGNMIYESADGLSAMILGGRGLGVANSKNEDGTWAWRTATTGYGMTADEITTGHLSAERIEAGSITAEKLMSNVGQELEISSNKALTLFATEDGSRPAGTVHTTDALIDIRAGYIDENENPIPAEISIVTGGELNLTGGKINVTSNGELNVASSGEFTLTSKGAGLNTTTDGIYLSSEGINLGGGKFKVIFSGQSSTVDITAGYVAIGVPGNEVTKFRLDGTKGVIDIAADNEINITSGNSLKLISSGGNVVIGSGTKPFTIGANASNAYIYNGLSSISGTTDGVYLGTNGLYIRGTSNNVTNYIKATAAGTVDISGKITATSGSIGGWTIGSNYIGSASTLANSKVGISSANDYTFWAGSNNRGSSSQFSVTPAGKVKCADLSMTGGSINGDAIKITAACIDVTGVINWPVWQANHEYAVGDKVRTSSSVLYTGYVCKTAHTSGSEWSSTNWTGYTNHINLVSGDSSVKLTPTKIDIATGGSAINLASNQIKISSTSGSSTNYIQLTPDELIMNATGVFKLSGKDTSSQEDSYIKLFNGTRRVFEANSSGVVYATEFQGSNIVITNATVTGSLTVNQHNIVIPRIVVDTGTFETVKNKYTRPFYWVKPGGGSQTVTESYESNASIANTGSNSPSSPVTSSASVTSSWSNSTMTNQVLSNSTIKITVTVSRVIGTTNVTPGIYVYAILGNGTRFYLGDISIPAASPGQARGSIQTRTGVQISKTYSGGNTTLSHIEYTRYGNDDSYFNRTTTSNATVSLSGTKTTTTGSDFDTIKYIA